MNANFRRTRVLCCGCVITSLLNLRTPARAQAANATSDKPTPRAIVSPSHSRDSRGDTVYEVQGRNQKDITPVPGLIVPPSLVHSAQPEYSDNMRRHRVSGEVVVEGVISPAGDFIDRAAIETSFAPAFEREANESALRATRQYRFRPATLDGHPVAVLVRVTINYSIR